MVTRDFEGSTKKRIEYCKHKDGFFCYLRAFQGHSGVPIESELMDFVFILGYGLIPGGTE